MGMKRWSYSDRRRLLRVDCSFEVEVRKDRETIKAEVRNMGLGGLQVLCHGLLEKGESIQVRLPNTKAPVRYDTVTCQVRWSQKSGPVTLVGLHFTEDESYMTRSWVFHTLKALGREAARVYQKREAVRVDCVLPATLKVGKEQRSARLRDLGLNGARVESEGAVIEHGTLLKLRFGPYQRLPRVSVFGEVILVRGHRVPHYGLKFNRFEEGSPETVARYLELFFNKE